MEVLGLGGLSCGGTRDGKASYPTPRSSLRAPSADQPATPLSFDTYLASPDGDEGSFVPRVVSAKSGSDSARKQRARGLNSPRSLLSPRSRPGDERTLSPRSSRVTKIEVKGDQISPSTGLRHGSPVVQPPAGRSTSRRADGGLGAQTSRGAAAASGFSRIQEITALLSRLAEDEQLLGKASPDSLKRRGAARRRVGNLYESSRDVEWTHSNDIETDWKQEMVRDEGNVVSRRLWGREEGALQLAIQQQAEREETERLERERDDATEATDTFGGVLLTERSLLSMSEVGSRRNGAGGVGGTGSVVLETELEKMVPGWPVAWEERPCVLRREGVRGGASIDYYKDGLERLAGRVRGHMDLYPASQVHVAAPDRRDGEECRFTVVQNGGKRLKWVLRSGNSEVGLLWVAAVRAQIERLQLQVLTRAHARRAHTRAHTRARTRAHTRAHTRTHAHAHAHAHAQGRQRAVRLTC